MKDISRTGHQYKLDHLDHVGGPLVTKDYEILSFVQKEADLNGKFVVVQNGTTNEEVIAMLIDRIQKLNTKFPCHENEVALHSLRLALSSLHLRTARREARGVEGKAVL